MGDIKLRRERKRVGKRKDGVLTPSMERVT
jgi:hypothetical protein